MKKTLVGVVVMVIGLSLTAAALPPVTLNIDPLGTCPMPVAQGNLSDLSTWQFGAWVGVLAAAKANELKAALFDDPTADPWDWDAQIAGHMLPLDQIDMELIQITESGPEYIFANPGDGVPDLAQLMLLGAAICADDDLNAQFQANLALVNGLLTNLNNLIAAANTDDVSLPTAQALAGVVTEVGAFAASLTTFATAVGALPGMAGTATALAGAAGSFQDGADGLEPLAIGLYGYASELLPLMTDDMATIVGPLALVNSIIAMESGLSSEMNATIGALLGSLIEELGAVNEDLIDGPEDFDPDTANGATPADFMLFLAYMVGANHTDVTDGLTALAGGLAAPGQLADQLTGLATALTGAGQTELAATATTLAASATTIAGHATAAGTLFATNYVEITNVLPVIADKLDDPQWPTFSVYGSAGPAKMAGEPFSGAGDYNGDTVTNAATWAGVAGAGGTVADFVAGASGADEFYPGNPLLPAAGLLGLAALVSAIAGGGAFVLRKK